MKFISICLAKSKFFLQSLFHLWALIMEIISRSSAQRHVIKRRSEKNGKKNRRNESTHHTEAGKRRTSAQQTKGHKRKTEEKRKNPAGNFQLFTIYPCSFLIIIIFNSTVSARYRPRRCRHTHGHTKKVGIFLRFHSFRLRWWWITQITRALFHASQGTWLSVRIWCWLCAMFRE